MGRDFFILPYGVYGTLTLNPKIRGWANYHRHNCASETFSSVDQDIFKCLWSWAKRRHPRKPYSWIKRKYFRSIGYRNWVFSVRINNNGLQNHIDLVAASSVKIRRHIKIKCEAIPYDQKYIEYFKERDRRQKIAATYS